MNSSVNPSRGEASPDAGPARGGGPVADARSFNIGICGLGTVASGLVGLLSHEGRRLGQRVGRALELKRIASRTPKPDLVPEGVYFGTDLFDLVEDPGVDMLVELMGGVDPALRLIERALELGKPVVTANKEVLAKHGDALFSLAAKNGVPIGFEASVGGGIPIIKAMRESLAGDQVTRIVGIVNGTTNFILSRMAENGTSFKASLQEAQDLGFAEAEPDYDIDGTDAAHKIAILAAIAWGLPFDVASVDAQGMQQIRAEDLEFAERLGYSIRHLGVARVDESGVETRVYPALVHQSNLLAQVRGVTNAVEVSSRSLGKSLYMGAGAGALPTANSVLADILDIASGNVPRPVSTGSASVRRTPASHSTSSFYLHVQVDDKTGVLAQLAEVLANKGIGIDALLQPEIGERTLKGADAASIVLVTHETTEAKMLEAVELIEALPEVRGKASLIRVYDGD